MRKGMFNDNQEITDNEKIIDNLVVDGDTDAFIVDEEHIIDEPKVDMTNFRLHASHTRIFKRIYVCLGALKLGFTAGLRDILGLDGAFMKGPFPGQVLTACLGSDLKLGMMSNFTFVTDRQKGVIPAISKLFPCAEHRFCVRHIHENMNNTWKGVAYKDMLWRCARATTIVEF
nr:hypothetical protein [Tanacetum cinerariifolium]